MRRKVLKGILAIEAVVCVLTVLAKVSFEGIFSSAMAFPFEQIGLGLRALSLSGGAGNVLAIVIYFILSLLPVGILVLLKKRRGLNPEDGLIALLCPLLFAVLYFMVNPGSLPLLMSPMAGQLIGKAILGNVVYSILCGYLVLRILRLFYAGTTGQLGRYMIVMLNLLNVLFVYLIFVPCFGALLDSISALQAGNQGNEHLLGMSYVFLVIRFLVNALPYGLNVLVVFAALGLLNEMQLDRYSAETVGAAQRVSRFCGLVLTAAIVSNMAFNLLQLLFAKQLAVIDTSVQIPVFSILFMLAALLLTRFVAENKQLKDENDQFI